MRLNHINLPVSDVATAAGFLREFFGLSNLRQRETRKRALLGDDNGMVVNISNFQDADSVQYPEFFHIGFIRDNREEVDEAHRRLVEAGYKAEAPRSFHGSWTFFVEAPGGFTVEVQTYEG